MPQPAPLQHVRQLFRHDAPHVLAAEGPEHDDAVDAVDELRPEALMNGFCDVLRARPCAPIPEPVSCRIVLPRLEVRMMMQCRKSTVCPLASVRRPSSKTCRN